MNITGGKYNSLKVKVPCTTKVRPTLSKVREGVFNTLSSIINIKNASFLDCFGGSGIMSLEAISRGFINVLTIEKDYKTASIIKNNFNELGLTPNLIVKDAIAVMKTLNDKFDVIYIDPPYKMSDLYEKSLNIISENSLLNNDGIIILECKKGKFEFFIPTLYKVIKEKTYGETTILYLKANSYCEI